MLIMSINFYDRGIYMVNIRTSKKYKAAREYLEQLKILDTIIRQKIAELRSLKEISTNLHSLDYLQNNGKKNISPDASFVRLVNSSIDLGKEINEQIRQYANKKHEIIDQIHKLKDNKYVEILFKHYVEYKSLEVVAEEMDFAYNYLLTLHGYALQMFQICVLDGNLYS